MELNHTGISIRSILEESKLTLSKVRQLTIARYSTDMYILGCPLDTEKMWIIGTFSGPILRVSKILDSIKY